MIICSYLAQRTDLPGGRSKEISLLPIEYMPSAERLAQTHPFNPGRVAQRCQSLGSVPVRITGRDKFTS
jgi:hypothetical protein